MKKLYYTLLLASAFFAFNTFSVNAQNCYVQNSCMSFNGTSARFRISNFNSLNSMQITLEAWINPASFGSGNKYILSRGGGSCEPEGHYSLRLNAAGNVEFVYSQNSSYSPCYRTDAAVPLNQWTHIALTYNFSNYAVAFYINGQPATATWITAPTLNVYSFTTLSDLSVGARASVTSTCNTSPPSAISDHYNGLIDEVRMFNTVVAPTVIAGFYNKSVSAGHPNYSNCIANFRMDEAPNSPMNYSSFNVNGFMTGGVAWSYNASPINNFTPNCGTYGIYGVGTAGDPTTTDNLTALTVNAWVMPGSLSAGSGVKTIVGKYDGSAASNIAFRIYHYNSGIEQLRAEVSNGSATQFVNVAVASALTQNVWTYLSMTWAQNDNVRLYANGNLIGTSAGTLGGTLNANTASLKVGGSDSPQEGVFVGTTDEVSIFSAQLSQATIQSMMNTTITSAHPNYYQLRDYWRFNEGGKAIASYGCGKNTLWISTGAVDYSFKPCNQPDSIGPVLNLTATTNNFEKVTVTWDNPFGFPGGVNPVPMLDGSVAYDIYRDNVYLTTQYSVSGTNTYIDNNPVCSHTYKVIAFWRKYSTNQILVYSPPATTIGSLQNINFQASKGTYLNKTTLSWTNISSVATGGFEVKRNGQQIAVLSSPSSTSYNDFDGTPGVRYVYEIKPLATGFNYKVCPDTGWIKENGRLSGYVKSPLQAPVPGVIVTATSTINGVNYTYSDTTDASGFYEIRNVYYNTQATYKLTPSKGTHQFNPAFLNRTLDVLAYNAPQANFIDTSVFTISGKVTYPNQIGNAGCPVAGAKILVNGADINITADNLGNWSFTASDEGTYTFTPVFRHHQFQPASSTIFVDDNVNGINFRDTTTDVLNLSLFGHCTTQICDYSIIKVTGTAASGCYDQTFTVPGNGVLQVTLPAQEYFVELLSVHDGNNANNALQIFTNTPKYQLVDMRTRDTVQVTEIGASEPLITGGDTVVLPNGQIVVTPLDTVITYDTVQYTLTPEHKAEYVYGGTLSIEVLGLDELASCNKLVVNQGNTYQIRVNVNRTYVYNNDTSYCPLDTGLLTMFDEVSDSNFVYYTIDSGIARYNINPGKPNIVGGGSHPYQKFIMFTASGEGSQNATTSIWMTVLGNRSLTPTFITKTPELPFFVLHDPPGDGSSATLTQGTTLSYGYETGVESSVGTNTFVNVQLGTEVPVPFTGIVFSAGGSLNLSLATNTTNTANKSVNTSFTVQNSFSTSDADDFVGEDADVVVGASLNLIYGLSYIVNYDTANCLADLDTALTWGANDFATTYAYTIGHIKNTLIPQFEFLRNFYQNQGSDSALIYQNYINVWNQVVEQNHTNIENAEFQENRSFSAGVAYTKTSSYENTSGFSISYQTSINPVIAAAINIGTENNNVEFGTEVNLSWTTTTNKSTEVTNSKEVTYTLTDDDAGDFFSVDIKRDKVYGTPAFTVVAGTSSCPHEEGTQQRDMPEILVLNPLQQNVPVTSQAVFTVKMTNLSESQETRTYQVIVDPNSNLDGAIIRLGGQLISQFPASFTIPANQSIYATLSVEKGPVAINYNNLRLRIYSPCDPDISDEAEFTVAFQSNCSPIALYTPSNNWLINTQSDTLIVTYGGFNANDTSLSQIGLEIRRPGQAWSTIPASLVSKLQLQQNNFPFYAVALNMSGLTDGNYEIRAFAICNTQPPVKSYSATLSGVVNRNSFALLGTPSPSDGVLNVGEDISVTFNDVLDCTKYFNQHNLVYDSVTLRRTDNGQLIPSQYTCSGSQIVITTNPPSLIDSLQNVSVTARVKNIYNQNGNILQTPVVWSFVVNRSKQYWNPSSLSISLNQSGTQNVTAALKNDGISPAAFTLVKVPAWMNTTTTNGNVPAGNFNNINFTVSANLNAGVYNDTVIADFGGGNKQFLFVQLVVKNAMPYWSVNPSQFQYSMNIIANFSLTSANAPLSTDVNDRIAVFADNQCRGVGNISYVQVGNLYAAFITVYSNSVSGEQLRFRMWDASTGTEYEAVETATFVNNAVLGQQLAPMILHPAGMVQRIPVAAGWNWFSLNVVSNNMSVNNMLRYLVADSATIVKTDNSYAQFSSSLNAWAGTLTNFGYEKSYMIFMSHADTLQFVGNPIADTVTIPFAQGWNWMGYPQWNVKGVNTHMNTFSAANNDVLKSQTQFATYSGGAWNGSLQQMQPGKGYKLQTANAGTVKVAPDRAAPGWNVSEFDYEYNMNVTAVLRVNGTDSYGGYLIGAFVSNNCIGVSNIQSAGGFARIFMTLHGNTSANNQPIEFRVYEYATDSIYAPAYTAINYTADAQAGSIENPFVLSFASPWSSVAHFDGNGYALYQNMPNPFNNQTAIRFVIPQTEKVTIEVYDYTGKQVRIIANETFVSGEHTVEFNQQELSSGIYFYRMRAGDFVQTKKMVIQ
ncbi:MAG: T9SS type A sorting domain-containing protein [Chitinophagales bacterium]|nr:T9SS type A sorting domain-containing protein [Chitinophagales bacterium]